MSRYYVVDSLCCPSRSAIFTGQYPHDDGVFTNAGNDGGYFAFNKHGDQQKSFALALHDAGYRTAMMGKYLNQYMPAYPEPPGWDEWDVAGNAYGEFDYNLNQNGLQQHYGKDPQDYLTDVLAAKASSFIDSSAASGRPFMLEVATFAPHAPYTPAPRYAHADQQLTYPKTPAYDRLPADPPPWLKGHPPLSAGRSGHHHRDVPQAGGGRSLRRRHDRRSSRTSSGPRAWTGTRTSCSARTTASTWASTRLTSGKQTAFETDIRVPLIVSGPGVPAGRDVSQLTSSIDLAPTFETLAGLPVPASVDGHSLAGLWHGQDPVGWPLAILIEHHGPDFSPDDPDRQTSKPGDPPTYEAVRTATALYVRYAGGAQEYYDTATDPYELDNLAGKGVPEVLRQALSALENCHGTAACWAAAQLG